MFSNSNAFMGGNSQRPGQQQPFGQGGFNNNLGQQQQNPSPFAPQPTGFAQQQQPQQTGFGPQQPLQQQFTGYPMQSQQTGMPQQQQPQQTGFGQQPLQQQYTGFPGSNQGFQSSSAAPPMPSIPAQYQQQLQQQQQQPNQQQSNNQAFGQQTTQQPSPFPQPAQQQSPAATAAPMKPQPTGFSQMAASFQAGAGSQSAAAPKAPGKTNKIPNIRLSFITAQDQTRFETLFKSAIGDDSTMSGDKARDLLLRSKLDGDTLSQIW